VLPAGVEDLGSLELFDVTRGVLGERLAFAERATRGRQLMSRFRTFVGETAGGKR
jgi:hypothetical protein